MDAAQARPGGRSKSAFACRLGISRYTIHRLREIACDPRFASRSHRRFDPRRLHLKLDEPGPCVTVRARSSARTDLRTTNRATGVADRRARPPPTLPRPNRVAAGNPSHPSATGPDPAVKRGRVTHQLPASSTLAREPVKPQPARSIPTPLHVSTSARSSREHGSINGRRPCCAPGVLPPPQCHVRARRRRFGQGGPAPPRPACT